MKTAIEYLEPLLSGGDDEGPKVTIVIATVEGDIHDIGKKSGDTDAEKTMASVLLIWEKMFRKEDIVDTAIKEDADIIALSALMTTTMMRMKDVVELVKEKRDGYERLLSVVL